MDFAVNIRFVVSGQLAIRILNDGTVISQSYREMSQDTTFHVATLRSTFVFAMTAGEELTFQGGTSNVANINVRRPTFLQQTASPPSVIFTATLIGKS